MLKVFRIPEFEEVTKLVQEFANDFGACEVIFGTRNMCHMMPNKTVIMYTFPRMFRNGDDEFYENFISRYPRCSVISQITLSLLHEIGHMMTLASVERYDTNVASNKEYFELPQEKAATDWAGNFASKNLQFCLDFDTKFNSAFLKANMIFKDRERMRIALDFASK